MSDASPESDTPRLSDSGSEQTRADKVDVDRKTGVTITFGDGHVCVFANQELRVNCPCASCRDLRTVGQVAWPREGSPPEVTILNAELVGNWGISFAWNDGHGTGIFPFDSLRTWCEGR